MLSACFARRDVRSALENPRHAKNSKAEKRNLALITPQWHGCIEDLVACWLAIRGTPCHLIICNSSPPIAKILLAMASNSDSDSCIKDPVDATSTALVPGPVMVPDGQDARLMDQ
jgi:hypothetical protein